MTTPPAGAGASTRGQGSLSQSFMNNHTSCGRYRFALIHNQFIYGDVQGICQFMECFGIRIVFLLFNIDDSSWGNPSSICQHLYREYPFLAPVCQSCFHKMLRLPVSLFHSIQQKANNIKITTVSNCTNGLQFAKLCAKMVINTRQERVCLQNAFDRELRSAKLLLTVIETLLRSHSALSVPEISGMVKGVGE